MRKVLIVSTVGLIYDGITSVILSYLQAMNLAAFDISIVGTVKIEPSIRQKLEACGCRIIEFPNRKAEPLKYFFELTKFIRNNHIEVVHAHGNSGTMAVEMLAAWLGGCKKRIAHSHSTKCDHTRTDKILRPLFYLFYTDALACSYGAGKWLFGNREFSIMPNGRDVEKYKFDQLTRNRIREQLGIGNEIAIGHVGGFYEPKNHAFLADIFKEIRRIEPDCKLFMIGDGDLKPNIEKKCSGLDVTFTGNIDNVTDYLNVMDGMLLPSLFEGFPLVSIEWQLNGLPAVLSDTITRECSIGGNLEYLPLDCGAETWACKILELVKNSNRKTDSIQVVGILNDSPLNIKNSAAELEGIYLGKNSNAV